MSIMFLRLLYNLMYKLEWEHDMKLNEAIGKRIETIFQERGLSGYKVAKLGGVPKQVIYSILKCEYKKISIDVIYQITATLDMSLEEFFSDPMFGDISD